MYICVAHTCAPKKGLIFPRSTRPRPTIQSIYNTIQYINVYNIYYIIIIQRLAPGCKVPGVVIAVRRFALTRPSTSESSTGYSVRTVMCDFFSVFFNSTKRPLYLLYWSARLSSPNTLVGEKHCNGIRHTYKRTKSEIVTKRVALTH